MSSTSSWAGGSAESGPQDQVSRLFPATVGRFDDRADRAVIDGLTRWVEDHYREDLAKRPSKHVYVRTLPGPVIEQIDRLRDSPLIASLIGARVPAGSLVAPMKHTDELYMSNYNKDHGGDQGLFDRHYDGNLRFLSSSVVVRDRQRILLKCNYLVTRRNAALLGRAALTANTSVFYVVKAAMEYSKSPSTPPQVAVGLLCNLARLLNNIHPLIPLALIAAVAGGLGWATGWALGRLLA